MFCGTMALYLLIFMSTAHSQNLGKIDLTNLSFFDDPSNNWQIVGAVTAPLNQDNTLKVQKGTGILVNNPSKNKRGKDLYTELEYGDVDIELNVMMARNSNSGIYLQGRYEVQLLDSWTVKVPNAGDMGGIYERWDDTQPKGQKGYQGYPPRQNASRAPGLWQHLKISFQAPRFDKAGNKVANAKLLNITLNGVTIHEDVELFGPTRGAIGNGEVAKGPLRIQGDHGPVAFKNMKITRFQQEAPTVDNLEYQLYEGEFDELPDFSKLTPDRSGKSAILTTNLRDMPDRFLIRYSGTISVNSAGSYQFDLNTPGGEGLLRIGQNQVIEPFKADSGEVELPAGKSRFELIYGKQVTWIDPNFSLHVRSTGLRPMLLSDPNLQNMSSATPIYVDAREKPLLRSFMDLPSGDRLTHTVSVSSMDNIHYTYDLNRGTLVQLWRGRYLDATPMWYGRGDGSSRPHGSVEHLINQPVLTINALENRDQVWKSDTTGTGFRSKGYTTDAGDHPVFHYEIFGASVSDDIHVLPDGKGLTRTVTIDGDGEGATNDHYMLLARAKEITKTDQPNWYTVGGQSYYLRLDDLPAKPFIRTSNGRQELLVKADTPITYSILF